VVLEGWCLGFRALTDPELETKWRYARVQEEAGEADGQLGKLKLEDLQFVNNALREYGVVWE
jgi:pantothenate kinase-related protein Tda10